MTWRELYCKVSVGPTLAARGSPRDMGTSSDPSSSTLARSRRATGRGYLPTKMSGSQLLLSRTPGTEDAGRVLTLQLESGEERTVRISNDGADLPPLCNPV